MSNSTLPPNSTSYLPGEQRIEEECVEAFALAHTTYVSFKDKNQFATLPYIREKLDSHHAQLLIEKLLSIAVKVRFLDDQSGILKKYDRELASLGVVHVQDGEEEPIGIRVSLNKLIHHTTISVRSFDVFSVVVSVPGTRANPSELQIPTGQYSEHPFYVEAEGTEHRKSWTCRIDLSRLLDEILRVLRLRRIAGNEET